MRHAGQLTKRAALSESLREPSEMASDGGFLSAKHAFKYAGAGFGGRRQRARLWTRTLVRRHPTQLVTLKRLTLANARSSASKSSSSDGIWGGESGPEIRTCRGPRVANVAGSE